MLVQGWATSIVGGQDLLKKVLRGYSIFEKFYFKINKIYIREVV